MTAMVGIERLIEYRERDGTPFIAGTRVSVAWISSLMHEGLSAEQMQREVFEGRLSLAQLHAAIAFYLLNKDAVDAEIAERMAEYDRQEAALRAEQATRTR